MKENYFYLIEIINSKIYSESRWALLLEIFTTATVFIVFSFDDNTLLYSGKDVRICQCEENLKIHFRFDIGSLDSRYRRLNLLLYTTPHTLRRWQNRRWCRNASRTWQMYLYEENFFIFCSQNNLILDALNRFPFYLLPLKEQRMFVLVVSRMQRAAKFRIGPFAELNYETATKVKFAMWIYIIGIFYFLDISVD